MKRKGGIKLQGIQYLDCGWNWVWVKIELTLFALWGSEIRPFSGWIKMDKSDVPLK